MPAGNTLPDAIFFQNLLSTSSRAKSCKEMGVSPATLQKLLQGEPVAESVIQRIAKNLKVPIKNLIVPDPNRKIPTDPGFFEDLRVGSYIDHTRHRSGKLRWFQETVRLHRAIDGKKGNAFSGTIVNRFDIAFQVTAVRQSDYNFVISASNDSEICFFAMFTFLESDNILCGIWTGIDHSFNRIGIYRMFLSKYEIELSHLRELSRKFKARSFLDAQAIANVCKK